MQGREFLELARELLAIGKDSRHWRAVIIHAYYALLLECRAAMERWGLPPLSRLQVHSQIKLRLLYAGDSTLKRIGAILERLGERRNLANYDLRPLVFFAVPTEAQLRAQDAADALAMLSALDADPARRASAIASIRP